MFFLNKEVFQYQNDSYQNNVVKFKAMSNHFIQIGWWIFHEENDI